MSAASKTDSVPFNAKGQVVIPAGLRREFHIKDGTRAIEQATPDGIQLQPVTRWAIDRLHGALKRERKPGEKSFAEEWAEHKREELELEEAKYARSTAAR